MFKAKKFVFKRIVSMASAMVVALSLGAAMITNGGKAEAAMDYSELGSGIHIPQACEAGRQSRLQPIWAQAGIWEIHWNPNTTKPTGETPEQLRL